MIRSALPGDFDHIHHIINDAALAYKGIIPEDRWHEPYMTEEGLHRQMDDGVAFSCYSEDNAILGVMGIQDKGEVCLIRHAYVLTAARNRGIGTLLMKALVADVRKPILVGTWKAAVWAIRFYERNGFVLVGDDEKDGLLKRYWNIPGRQIETSVVLADGRFLEWSRRSL